MIIHHIVTPESAQSVNVVAKIDHKRFNKS